jgi:signal transduction histidine kinase
MNTHNRSFRLQVGVLAALLALAILSCITVAVLSANRSLRRMENVEFEAAQQARRFRSAVDKLNGAILRMGTDTAGGSLASIRERRANLEDQLKNRLAVAENQEEERVLTRLGGAMRAYSDRLDQLEKRTGGFTRSLDRDTIIGLDDAAIGLQNMADDYAAIHDRALQSLLQASLGSILRMRDLVFACLALLVAAVGVLAFLVHRNVVRPLRVQLIDSQSLLEKREKLAALGTLAAGVAHEIRNPLTAIKARLYTLRAAMDSRVGGEDVEAIAAEVDRLERIARDALGYARPEEPSLAPVELSSWLREFAEFVRPEVAARGIDLKVEAAQRADVRTDANQLRQIMLNLVRNAHEALAGRKGRIVLSLRRERSPLRGRPSGVAVLDVADDGPGIPADIQGRLFDPFFTTKAAGTGLGLSIVASLVEKQGGEIAFQSSPRAGTRFSVRLPLDGDAGQTGRK